MAISWFPNVEKNMALLWISMTNYELNYNACHLLILSLNIMKISFKIWYLHVPIYKAIQCKIKWVHTFIYICVAFGKLKVIFLKNIVTSNVCMH